MAQGEQSQNKIGRTAPEWLPLWGRRRRPLQGEQR